METELEAKFLDIDKEALRNKLKEIGAKLIYPERLMKRNVFDYPDCRLEKTGAWIRVRDEGDKATLSYKQLLNRKMDGTKEVSVVVDDFEKTSQIFLSIGLEKKSYQETKRERWDLEGVEVTIDTWPWIPTFVEIEGESEEKLREVAKKLNLDWAKALHGSVENAYQAYYDVSEKEVDSWEKITFVPVPDWLEEKKKQ